MYLYIYFLMCQNPKKRMKLKSYILASEPYLNHMNQIMFSLLSICSVYCPYLTISLRNEN